ncbi:MAG: hypothetical protein LKG27_02410 [Clostridiaceae bacterium]|jgi:hypothetical protein|nr:hypothetical protein [Clostridiaceae bacterium]
MTDKLMTLIDEFGIIREANQKLSGEFKLQLIEALAELEDNKCYILKQFPKTRLHKVKGVKQSIYRADIDKISGWRIHLQYDKQNTLKLKQIIEGKRHDDCTKVIKSQIGRYQ